MGEYDERLRKVFLKIRETGLKLNKTNLEDKIKWFEAK